MGSTFIKKDWRVAKRTNFELELGLIRGCSKCINIKEDDS